MNTQLMSSELNVPSGQNLMWYVIGRDYQLTDPEKMPVTWPPSARARLTVGWLNHNVPTSWTVFEGYAHTNTLSHFCTLGQCILLCLHTSIDLKCI